MKTKYDQGSFGTTNWVRNAENWSKDTRSNIRLCILIIAYKDLKNNTRVFRIAKALSDRGHKVTVFSIGMPDASLVRGAKIDFVESGTLRPFAPQFLSYLPFAKFLISICQNTLRVFFPLRTLEFAIKAREKLRHKKFDMQIVHSEFSALASFFVDIRNRHIKIYDAIEVPYYKGFKSVNRILLPFTWFGVLAEKICLKRCKHIFTVSESLAEWLIEKNIPILLMWLEIAEIQRE